MYPKITQSHVLKKTVDIIETAEILIMNQQIIFDEILKSNSENHDFVSTQNLKGLWKAFVDFYQVHTKFYVYQKDSRKIITYLNLPCIYRAYPEIASEAEKSQNYEELIALHNAMSALEANYKEVDSRRSLDKFKALHEFKGVVSVPQHAKSLSFSHRFKEVIPYSLFCLFYRHKLILPLHKIKLTHSSSQTSTCKYSGKTCRGNTSIRREAWSTTRFTGHSRRTGRW